MSTQNLTNLHGGSIYSLSANPYAAHSVPDPALKSLLHPCPQALQPLPPTESLWNHISSNYSASRTDVMIDILRYADEGTIPSAMSAFKDNSIWIAKTEEQKKQAIDTLKDAISMCMNLPQRPEIWLVDQDVFGYIISPKTGEVYPDETFGIKGLTIHDKGPRGDELLINKRILESNYITASTVVHEMWHCFQNAFREFAPTSVLGKQYESQVDTYKRPGAGTTHTQYAEQDIEKEPEVFMNMFISKFGSNIFTSEDYLRAIEKAIEIPSVKVVGTAP